MSGQSDPSNQLRAVLAAGHFALTAETTPQASTDIDAALRRAMPLSGLADAVNVTDGAGARAHLSSLVVAGAMTRSGLAPILQLTCRDRNRIAMQADILGAAALGIGNVLCLSGDPVEVGDEKDAKPVFDLDTVSLVKLIRHMGENGALGSGRAIDGPPRLLIGVADSPADPQPGWTPAALLAKLDAGGQFVQTQYCFDMGLCRRYLAGLADHGVTERAAVLIGIGPLASARQARWMNENLPGVFVPDALIARIEAADDERAEGRRICGELLQELRDIPHAGGAHLMAPGQEAGIAEVIADSGVLQARN